MKAGLLVENDLLLETQMDFELDWVPIEACAAWMKGGMRRAVEVEKRAGRTSFESFIALLRDMTDSGIGYRERIRDCMMDQV